MSRSGDWRRRRGVVFGDFPTLEVSFDPAERGKSAGREAISLIERSSSTSTISFASISVDMIRVVISEEQVESVLIVESLKDWKSLPLRLASTQSLYALVNKHRYRKGSMWSY